MKNKIMLGALICTILLSALICLPCNRADAGANSTPCLIDSDPVPGMNPIAGRVFNMKCVPWNPEIWYVRWTLHGAGWTREYLPAQGTFGVETTHWDAGLTLQVQVVTKTTHEVIYSRSWIVE